ncbi:hypothetical protein DFH28DRAFT_964472 [Melampsora americana]|nr:hypothetical protein DFH28DRAFT_964472 [Melampsora americana]
MKESQHLSNLYHRSKSLTITPKLTAEEEENCLLKSANVLATAFEMFQGAPIEVKQNMESAWGVKDTKKILASQCNALEMAIVSEAKQFIRSPACQRVIEAIWTGKIVYTSTAIFDIVSDRYKRRPVSLYNPRNAPLLNHYRLGVPRNRAALGYFNYGILIISYVATMETRELNRMNGYEIWFNIFTLGFALDKTGSILEHGWRVFIANLWNGFDAAFILGYLIYLSLRSSGLFYLSHYDMKSYWLNEQSHQVLSCLAIFVFPRLAFITLSDNLLILSLRSMMSDFVFLMLLGAWCFLGFLYSLYMLQVSLTEAGEMEKYSIGQIAKWMVYIFFGLDATGITIAHEFHRVLGPAIFIIYACLSNTLLVTVLVSILSKIFSDISNDAIAETLYRKAVLTFEGVKSDAIFSFQPPWNIPALLILIILKPFLTPRKFHTVVVFLCRFFGGPILLTISFFERYVVGPFEKGENRVTNSLKLSVVNSLGGLGIGSHFAPTSSISSSRNDRRKTKMSQMSSRITRNLHKFGGLSSAVIEACFSFEPSPPIHGAEEAGFEEDRVFLARRRPSDGGQTIRGGEENEASESQVDGDDQYATLKGRSKLTSKGRSHKILEGELEAGPVPRKANRRSMKRSHSQPGARGSRRTQDLNTSPQQNLNMTPLERLFLPEGYLSLIGIHNSPGRNVKPTSGPQNPRSSSVSTISSRSSSDTEHDHHHHPTPSRSGRERTHKPLPPYSTSTPTQPQRTEAVHENLIAPLEVLKRSISASSMRSVGSQRLVPRKSTRPASIIQNDEGFEREDRSLLHHHEHHEHDHRMSSFEQISMVQEIEEKMERGNVFRDKKIQRLMESQVRIEGLLNELIQRSSNITDHPPV